MTDNTPPVALEPCPKCDATEDDGLRTYKAGLWGVECTCGMCWTGAATRTEAITAWNTRTRTPSHSDLVEALRWYADQFCELGTSHECCGRLTPDECSGCKARAILTKAEAPHG